MDIEWKLIALLYRSLIRDRYVTCVTLVVLNFTILRYNRYCRTLDLKFSKYAYEMNDIVKDIPDIYTTVYPQRFCLA